MKVFNWVHRKFLCVHIRSDTALMQEDGKISSKKVDFEKNDLLEHDGHDEVSNWEKGFLAIGTLGTGPLDESIEPQCYDDEIIKEILDVHDHDHKENSLVLGDHLHADEDDEHVNIRNHEILLFRHELEKSGCGCNEIEEVTEDNVNVELKEDNQRKKTESPMRRRRVTLADLLSEDPDHHVLHIVEQVEDEYCHVQHNSIAIQEPNKIKKKKTTRAKNSFIKAKKLLKDDFRPIDTCNQLIKRLIRKKIHPDLEKKMKKNIQMQPTRNEVGPHQ